jgi:predicted Fe-Mo cluster-binding NifX family protein
MKICIPVIESKGLNSTVSDHFGRAPFHIVVDLESRAVTPLQKTETCNDETHGHCMPVDLLLAAGVNVVACKGIGRGAVNRLQSNQIGVFATHASTVSGVIDAFLAKQLCPVNESNLCDGHHHH